MGAFNEVQFSMLWFKTIDTIFLPQQGSSRIPDNTQARLQDDRGHGYPVGRQWTPSWASNMCRTSGALPSVRMFTSRTSSKAWSSKSPRQGFPLSQGDADSHKIRLEDQPGLHQGASWAAHQVLTKARFQPLLRATAASPGSALDLAHRRLGLKPGGCAGGGYRAGSALGRGERACECRPRLAHRPAPPCQRHATCRAEGRLRGAGGGKPATADDSEAARKASGRPSK